MKKKLFASAAAVAVAFSTLAPLVPADAAQGRQPLTHSQCQRLRGVAPWVPGYLNMKTCQDWVWWWKCAMGQKPYCE